MMTRACAWVFAAALAAVAAGCEEKQTTAEAPPAQQQPAPTAQKPAAVQAGDGGTTAGGAPDPAKVEEGKKLYTALGCVACHSTDGSPRAGPTLAELYGEEVTLADGSKVIADEAYLRTSILEPNQQMVKGFVPSMPAFKGRVSDEELQALIAFIHSLK